LQETHMAALAFTQWPTCAAPTRAHRVGQSLMEP
jgi:hypothetical protein